MTSAPPRTFGCALTSLHDHMAAALRHPGSPIAIGHLTQARREAAAVIERAEAEGDAVSTVLRLVHEMLGETLHDQLQLARQRP
jgi:cell division inhibitor SulA